MEIRHDLLRLTCCVCHLGGKQAASSATINKTISCVAGVEILVEIPARIASAVCGAIQRSGDLAIWRAEIEMDRRLGAAGPARALGATPNRKRHPKRLSRATGPRFEEQLSTMTVTTTIVVASLLLFNDRVLDWAASSASSHTQCAAAK